MYMAKIDTAASGATVLVAAQATRKIRVLSYHLVCSGAVTVKFQSGSTDLTGAMSFAANGGVVVGGSGSEGANVPLFETAQNAALNINLGGAVQVSGAITYDLIAR